MREIGIAMSGEHAVLQKNKADDTLGRLSALAQAEPIKSHHIK
jgi:hypothetical protein